MPKRTNPATSRRRRRPASLADCESQEEVAAELAAGNEALQEDVYEKLDEIKKRANRHHWESVGDENDWWSNGVIAEDIADYLFKEYPGLEGMPREYLIDAVQAKLDCVGNRTRRGECLFDTDNNGRRHRDMTTVSTTYFRSNLRVVLEVEDGEDEIPDDLVKDALNDAVSPSKGNEWVRLDDSWTLMDDGDPVSIVAESGKLDEFVHDQRSDYFESLYQKDPVAGWEAFKAQLPTALGGGTVGAEALARVLKHEKDIPADERASLASVLWDRNALHDSEEENIEALRSALEEFLGFLETPSLAEHDPARVVGVIHFKAKVPRGGTPAANDISPWTVIRLTPGDLSLEGRRLRHCVGKPDMGYVRALAEGKIEVWSVRNAQDKPLFTMEVEVDPVESDAEVMDRAPALNNVAEWRGSCVKQVKGTANRLPGFTDTHASVFQWPNEVRRLRAFFEGIDVDPEHVRDMKPGLKALGHDVRTETLTNPRTVVAEGFDAPYRPRRSNRRGG